MNADEMLDQPATEQPVKKKKSLVAKIALTVGLLVVALLAAGGITVGVIYANGGPEALLSAASKMPIPDSAREPAFNQAVKSAGGEYTAGRPESEVVAEARALCARLDAGESIQDVAMDASTGVNDLKGFGTVMGTGIVMFCPSHTDEMKQFLTDIGQADQAP
ncbi:DUF732 domain-containing protein [Pseudarthrobacter sp. BIM B-2242]|uniref:DUF732 domain-containing protein n=1 Tax=Pseudarthrobacter sp. BIM B-2242 TaxID=2772401 RepID=UPI00168AA051|nr:DUF732 domain-containing protein [Pseudarthrobacter sp. BIM B-2242]QOD05871.1 DUF732 domain-containing protein [Pseudarthrobacter sp. BIM B-2242]